MLFFECFFELLSVVFLIFSLIVGGDYEVWDIVVPEPNMQTGSGFISEEHSSLSFTIGDNGEKIFRTTSKTNPATNEWQPSPPRVSNQSILLGKNTYELRESSYNAILEKKHFPVHFSEQEPEENGCNVRPRSVVYFERVGGTCTVLELPSSVFL